MALTADERDALLVTLQVRFEDHPNRHPDINWSDVKARLKANPDKLTLLQAMEDTGGEPDVVGQDEATDAYLFFDCSPESPKGRRSLCYDQEALENRKKHPPKGNVLDTAAEIGVDLLTEDQYRQLQSLGEFDLKTESWIQTPQRIRDLGGALFMSRRYDTVFVYHNSAPSYYASRGFRGSVWV